MKLLKIIFIVFLLFYVSNVFAYKPKRTNNFSSYKDKTQEFGYALNLSYLKFERTFSPQLHFHYAKYITEYFSIGMGYGGIYDEHFHNTLNLELSFRFTKKLILSLKPGVVYKKDRGKGIVLYSVGLGSYYKFPITESINIGPMVEVNLVQDDVNYIAGFHMGFAF